MSAVKLGDQTRPEKPRTLGRTAIIDGGLPPLAFHDVIDHLGLYIDAVKFGWCTSLVTPFIRNKIHLLSDHKIPWWFGGTLFERFYLEGRVEDFIAYVKDHGGTHVEVSDGTVDIPHAKKLGWIEVLARDFTVISEVGKKAGDVEPDAQTWCRDIRSELAAGADWIILEGRESGTAGLYDGQGRPRDLLVSKILDAGIPLEHLFFEAPSKEHQTFFINTVGLQVNLSNIPPSEVIGVETLRRRLRSDTFWEAAAEENYDTNQRMSA